MIFEGFLDVFKEKLFYFLRRFIQKVEIGSTVEPR